MIRVPVAALSPEAAAPLLTERERAALAAFPVEKRRAEWLAGTLAAKAAIRERIGPVPWDQIEVLNGPDKDRIVTLPPGAAPIGVTLSHAAGIAVAEAFDPRVERVGVDVDAIAERAPSFLQEAFSEEERGWIGQDPVLATTAWCVKEAVLKALGVGLSVPLHDVTVAPPAMGHAVTLRGAAEARRVLLNGKLPTVAVVREGDRVLAVARMAVG